MSAQSHDKHSSLIAWLLESYGCPLEERGVCTTLACLKRGGYKGGPTDHSMATCHVHELVTLLRTSLSATERHSVSVTTHGAITQLCEAFKQNGYPNVAQQIWEFKSYIQDKPLLTLFAPSHGGTKDRADAALHACEGLDTADLKGNAKGWLSEVVYDAARVESDLNSALRARCPGNGSDPMDTPVCCQSYEAHEQGAPCPPGCCVMAEEKDVRSIIAAIEAEEETAVPSTEQHGETPRTDAFERRVDIRGQSGWPDAYFECLALARQLERELAESTEIIEEMRKRMDSSTPSSTATPVKADASAPWEWPVDTVGRLMENLKALPPHMPFYVAYFVEIDGKSVAKTMHPSVSRETVFDGRIQKYDAERVSLVMWAAQDARSAIEKP
jgi:hypothetical protein